MLALFDNKRATNNNVEEEEDLIICHLDLVWALDDTPSHHVLIIQLEGQVLLDTNFFLFIRVVRLVPALHDCLLEIVFVGVACVPELLHIKLIESRIDHP